MDFSGETNHVGQSEGDLVLAAVLGFGLWQPLRGAEPERKVVNRVKAVYPELARQMNVTGTVKIEVVIAANGTVKSVKPVGGHPLLIQSTSDAVRKWQYAPGPETKTVVEFQFHPAE
jgi:TonB family protein